ACWVRGNGGGGGGRGPHPGNAGRESSGYRDDQAGGEGTIGEGGAELTGKMLEKEAVSGLSKAAEKGLAKEGSEAAAKEGSKTAGETAAKTPGKTFDQARREAFEKAGMTDPSKVKFTKVDPK